MKTMTHEFIKDLPNHPRTEVRNYVIKWISINSKTERPVTEYQDRDVWSIVSAGDIEIKPDGPGVNMKMGFTMNIDVKNERIRVRFTNLRRLYGSKRYDVSLDDEFFRTPTALPYQLAAQTTFANFVQSLTEFIVQRTGDVATK